ncbi:outer membrane protein [Novosphingobium cyanobacteriorum]|uniref:Outer membrane beta-barrel protein n=1 Tax=Novosphingobium cyanobacteriorum TaxID=3024215 RepID=A0ABT6CIU4_9SPHN|nr:outer membrane beta-barrel protein [Novosphingobium cyanobacteriorum]MDF8333439.1 outer membrane beta-barrel protein [Novosphingobium cyanobacteriorum]
MRLVLTALAAAAAVAATPALANEIRAEGRGGVIWDQGTTEAIAGVAVGYDYDLAPKTFVGIEASADKILTSNTIVSFGVNARAGVSVPVVGKLYATGGYATKPCHGCEESWNLGAGVQHTILPMTYLKLEYRHYFVGNGFSDPDAVVAGVGIKF